MCVYIYIYVCVCVCVCLFMYVFAIKANRLFASDTFLRMYKIVHSTLFKNNGLMLRDPRQI